MRDIILLHGAIGAKDQLNLLADLLKQYGYTVHCLNFSGHGKTPFNDQFGIDQFASELEAYINSNDLKHPHVFGYSMGGYVALYLAKLNTTCLGNIITLGTKFSWSPEIAAKEVKMLDPKVIAEKVPKFADTLKMRHGSDWETLMLATAKMMYDLGEDNILNELSTIENKVMIGLADKDNMVSLDETLTIYHQLKNASMYMLPGTKHPIETVNVGLLAKLINDFTR